MVNRALEMSLTGARASEHKPLTGGRKYADAAGVRILAGG